MTSPDMLRTRTLAELDRLAGSGALAAKAAASCAALTEKLRAPVRIGLVGLPGAGKRVLLNALAEAALLDPARDWPTLEVMPGERARTRATLADGSLLDRDGPPDPALLRQGPVFLRLTSPAGGLEGRRLLLVASDASAEDLSAGLRWAAPRVDILLWLSTLWHPAERQVWQTAPDSLRNHAVLLLTGDGGPQRLRASDEGFDAVFRIDARGSRIDRLAEHLRSTIGEAMMQDLHGAQLFLQRHGAPVQARTAAPQAAAEIVPLRRESAPPGETEARTELGRLFQLLRRAAEDLRRSLAAGEEEPERLAEAFDKIFETLAERCADLPRLSERWPDLGEEIAEARDLAVLMRIEGGAGQAGDAARLLCQIRTGIEERLAA